MSAVTARSDLQGRMEALNPGWTEAHLDVEIRPDGDAHRLCLKREETA